MQVLAQIRSIDFFKITKASGHPVEDVIKAWDGREFINEDKLEDYLKRWSDRIKSGVTVSWEEIKKGGGKEI